MYKIIKDKKINVELVRGYFGEEIYKEFQELNEYNKYVLSEHLDRVENAIKSGQNCADLKAKFIEELNYLKNFE